MRISEKVSKMATNKIYCVVYIHMISTVIGGRKKKTMRIGRKRRSIQLGGMGSLSPADLEVSGGMSPDVNFNAGGFPQKAGNKMVGGSYGYTGGDEVKPFGGSYAPYSVSGGSESGDLTRGGNNILAGGGYRRRRGRGTMRRMRKWSMKGCMGTTKRRRRSPSFFSKIFS